MKKLFILICISFFISELTYSQNKFAYSKGEKTVQLGFGVGNNYSIGNTIIPPVQAKFEYGVTENISVGGVIGFAKSSTDYDDVTFNSNGTTRTKKSSLDYSYTIIGGRANYHLVTKSKFDPYGGITLGYNNISFTDTGSYDLGFATSFVLYGFQIGTNYYFTKNVGAWAEVGYGISYLNLGLTYRLK